jgi:outer membrane immunogenic protein
MKKLAIAIAVAGLIGTPAFAADMAAKAPPPAPAPQMPSWTGFYFGFHLGAAWQSSTNMTFFDPGGFFAPESMSDSADARFLGGFQGGYNWQFAPAWVIGAEGDVSWTRLNSRGTITPLIGPVGAAGGTSLTMSETTDWLASIRGRLGFTGWYNTMLYVTGGGAWANIGNSGLVTVGPPTAGAGAFFAAPANISSIVSGWVVGGGAEYMLTPNILLRAEYLYYKFDDSANAFATFTPPAGTEAAIYHWSSNNIQVARVGASFKF